MPQQWKGNAGPETIDTYSGVERGPVTYKINHDVTDNFRQAKHTLLRALSVDGIHG
jgi:hypothetical protein